LIAPRVTSPPRLALLSSPTSYALRSERGSLIAWLVGIGGFALVMGMISHSFAGAHLSESLQRQVAKFGGASITTPAGALGLYFLFFVFAISLFACAQLAALRREESDQRLETLFALPIGRRRWLGGRLAVIAGGIGLLALAAGVLAWAGAASQGGGVSFADMLGAGANCLPASLLFLGLGALVFATLPRATVAVVYLLVSVTFLWELVGDVVAAPEWTLALSPFHDIGLVPSQAFKATEAIVMLALGAAATVAALVLFKRRDLTGT
jgi:ABC-2 type transport system permease protein